MPFKVIDRYSRAIFFVFENKFEHTYQKINVINPLNASAALIYKPVKSINRFLYESNTGI